MRPIPLPYELSFSADVLKLAIGDAGAVNAGLLAAAIIALHDPAVADKLDAYRASQTARVLGESLS